MDLQKLQQLRAPEVNMAIVKLFLEKLELLSPRERAVLIKTIDILSHPVFLAT